MGTPHQGRANHMTSLDADQMNRLTIEATLGKPPSIPGAEAKAFYDAVRADVAAMKAKGIMPMPLPE